MLATTTAWDNPLILLLMAAFIIWMMSLQKQNKI